MQEGKSFQIYNAENSQVKQSKKRANETTKPRHQRRRPLGDICNILPADKERTEKKIEKVEQDKDEFVTTQFSDDEQFSKENVTEQCECLHADKYESLERALDLGKRENEIAQKERLYGLTEYVDDVYKYLRYLEGINMIGNQHLDGLEMTEKTRAILVDWMVEVHSHFSLCPETLQLSIYILDRFTELKRNLNKRNAQLIGLVALFLAAKYEETEPLEICDIVFVSDSAVTQKEIIRAERVIFKTIGYNLSRPLPVQFVRRYSKISGVTPMEHAYATYFCDAALLEYSLCSARPSVLAASALFLALCVSKDVIDIKLWNENLIKYTTYHLTDFYHLLPRIAVAVQLCYKGKLEAIRKKYSTAEKYYVSMMPCVQPAFKGSVIEHFCQ